MKKNRVEAFTDAIVAIILTIMVLEIKVPEGTSEFSALIEKAPYFIAFIISFIFKCISIPFKKLFDYLEKCSLKNDIAIMVKTVIAVLK